MPTPLTSYRIFIASPGGLEGERQAFRQALDDYNEESALRRGVHFRPIGWEATLGGFGRPQTLINEDIMSCDYFVILLFDRWGSTPDAPGEERYSSGAEEEYNLALECRGNDTMPMRDVVVFFKGVEEGRLRDPGQQLQKVLDFRKSLDLSKTIFYRQYDAPEEFVRHLRRHLAEWLAAHESSDHQLSRATTGDRDGG